MTNKSSGTYSSAEFSAKHHNPLKLMLLLNRKSAILLIFGLAMVFNNLQAQIVLRRLSVNPALINQNHKTFQQLRTLAVKDASVLPLFWDDFSTTTVYPNPNNWTDNKVFINNTYPVNPLSIGVATFDMLDENGSIYKNASTKPFGADTLTSRPIDLTSDTSHKPLMLSFYIEAQGLGDAPEIQDSFLVDFYDPSKTSWKTVDKFNVKDTIRFKSDVTKNFLQIIDTIPDEYKQKGFRFRFHNLASIDSSDIAGRNGNADFWHIDYVMIDTTAQLNDVAFVQPSSSLLNLYQAMPWNQFVAGQQILRKPSYNIKYRNNSNSTTSSIQVYYRAYEVLSNKTFNPTDSTDKGSGSTDPNAVTEFPVDIGNPFHPTESTAFHQFDIKTYLDGTNDFHHENDTIHYRQVFPNYFAYDDGTSENGFGIVGEGTANASVAYQFKSYTTDYDTLTGISMYFNPTEYDTTRSYTFNLSVWADNKGIPGKLVYSQSTDSVKKAKLNQFYNFKFDKGIPVKGLFYAGFTQTSEDFLNIGFDLNTDSHNYLYYNINGNWYQSGIIGSLMMRPIFGATTEGPVTGKKNLTNQSFRCYPNPASDHITIVTGNSTYNKQVIVDIYDITGKIVLSEQVQDNSCSVVQLPNGLYIVRLKAGDEVYKPVKILIQH